MLDIKDLHRLFEKAGKPSLGFFSKFKLAGKTIDLNETHLIMGVINLSADSWYRESVCLSAESAIRKGLVLTAQGADILDIGAESSLAHAARIEADAQKSILVPVVRELSSRGSVVSVETYSPWVAEAVLDAGAKVLNITGTIDDREIFKMAADQKAAVILCYVQGPNVREVSEFEFSSDPVGAMLEHFKPRLELASELGASSVFVDPGLGFYYRNLKDSSVRIRHQMRVFLESFRFSSLGAPVCHALPHAFENFGEEVRTAESFFAVLAALGNTRLFRTHEVPKIKAVLDTLQLNPFPRTAA